MRNRKLGSNSILFNILHWSAGPLSGNVHSKLKSKCTTRMATSGTTHYIHNSKSTLFSTTGASDDAVACSVLLEILRAIASDKKPLLHPLILLFNGAEETILQASHGFITQHKWVDEVRPCSIYLFPRLWVTEPSTRGGGDSCLCSFCVSCEDTCWSFTTVDLLTNVCSASSQSTCTSKFD